MDTIEYCIVKTAPTDDIVALYRAGGWWKESQAARDAIPPMIRGSFRFILARDASGRAVGMGRAISDGASDAYIQDLVVLPEYRGRGIGNEIVRRLVQECRKAQITWIGVIAEPGTSQFYRPLGFEPMPDYTPMLFRWVADEPPLK